MELPDRCAALCRLGAARRSEDAAAWALDGENCIVEMSRRREKIVRQSMPDRQNRIILSRNAEGASR